MDANLQPRVALVHDWLTGMRGGEKCLDVLCRRWPHAELFTLIHTSGQLARSIEQLAIHTSFLQRLPGVNRYYRYLLPLMPAAIESFRLAGYDLVVSLSHCVAKGIRPPPGVPHVCYCFTPMRYAWHLRAAYFAGLGALKGVAVRALLRFLQDWDVRTAARVTHFIAISKTVQQRIWDCYGRDSAVIYPPVNTSFYTPARVRREDYYLVVSAFAPYKRIDLAIEACNRLQRCLLVIGTGQDERRLKALAGPTIRFAGWQPDPVIRDHFRRCRALLFPGEEDFGIVPLEAQACGTPVIAFGRGGATETILPLGGPAAPTGVWFAEQTADALLAAMTHFESCLGEFAPGVCRRQAQRFNQHRFEQEIMAYLWQLLDAPDQALPQAA
jgi:glycosyltransferase involved in cell wall biosynthesis